MKFELCVLACALCRVGRVLHAERCAGVRHCLFFIFVYFRRAENAKQKSDDNRALFRERYDAMQTNAHELLKKASRRKWTCDKDNYPGEENATDHF